MRLETSEAGVRDENFSDGVQENRYLPAIVNRVQLPFRTRAEGQPVRGTSLRKRA